MSDNEKTMRRFVLKRIKGLYIILRQLSLETDNQRQLEIILQGAQELSHSDSGTIFSVHDDRELRVEFILNDALHLNLGGTSQNQVPFNPVPLYNLDGTPNLSNMVSFVAHKKRNLSVDDLAGEERFKYWGAEEIDATFGYETKSVLNVPLKDNRNEVIGVLQLINSMDEKTSDIVAFSEEDSRFVKFLAFQAAVTLNNYRLNRELTTLFESFVDVIATAIDEKSPYTGEHCKRVPILTMALSKAAEEATSGPLKDFKMSQDDRYELKLAALVHDCGKVTTPVHVQDKATKLESIFDRIDLIDTRFEVIKRDSKIHLLEQKLMLHSSGRPHLIPDLEKKYQDLLDELDTERDFLRQANIGVEFMSDNLKGRVHKIAERKWIDAEGKEANLLTPDEVKNLCITKGTLSDDEREIIQNHIVSTIKMLEKLPYPKHLRRIPEFAGGHHERMDGKGYPKGLKRDEMSWQARMMGIADIFEALTACDRPYKKGKTILEALTILGYMKLDGHIDPDLFDLFVESGVYENYARNYLKPYQMVRVDKTKIPGYKPKVKEERDDSTKIVKVAQDTIIKKPMPDAIQTVGAPIKDGDVDKAS